MVTNIYLRLVHPVWKANAKSNILQEHSMEIQKGLYKENALLPKTVLLTR